MQPIKLLIICDSMPTRRSLGFLFSSCSDFQVAGEIEAATSPGRLQLLQPDVVLLAPGGPDQRSMDLISSIKEICPCTITAVLADPGGYFDLAGAFMAGADACLSPPMLPADLITAVDLACRSGLSFLSGAARDLFKNFTGAEIGGRPGLLRVKKTPVRANP